MRTALTCFVVFFLLLASHTYTPAQEGQPVNQSFGPPPAAYQSIYYYSGTNLTFVCTAPSRVAETTITVSGASNANPVSFTATAHGFEYQSAAYALPAIKITGGTGNWTVINGVWVATPTSANAFTIPVNSTSLGALTGTLVVTTLAPRINQPVWSLRRALSDGSNNFVFSGWGTKVGGAGATNLVAGSPAMNKRCDERTASDTAYQ